MKIALVFVFGLIVGAIAGHLIPRLKHKVTLPGFRCSSPVARREAPSPIC
jgi:hypothetical protein